MDDWFIKLPEEARKAILEAKEQGEQGAFMDSEVQAKKLRELLKG